MYVYGTSHYLYGVPSVEGARGVEDGPSHSPISVTAATSKACCP